MPSFRLIRGAKGLFCNTVIFERGNCNLQKGTISSRLESESKRIFRNWNYQHNNIYPYFFVLKERRGEKKCTERAGTKSGSGREFFSATGRLQSRCEVESQETVFSAIPLPLLNRSSFTRKGNKALGTDYINLYACV